MRHNGFRRTPPNGIRKPSGCHLMLHCTVCYGSIIFEYYTIHSNFILMLHYIRLLFALTFQRTHKNTFALAHTQLYLNYNVLFLSGLRRCLQLSAILICVASIASWLGITSGHGASLWATRVTWPHCKHQNLSFRSTRSI